jgi:type III pantothenate kinase
MTSLLIDVGNTRIKSAICKGAVLLNHQSAAWRDKSNLTELFTSLWATLDVPRKVYISCVAGQSMEDELIAWFTKTKASNPVFARTSIKEGALVCGYQKPQQLGVDRWVAVQAAITLTEKAVFVVDCGTATTIDVVTADKVHHGGAILPGISTMRSSLAGGTAHLDVPSGKVVAFATNTQDAIAGGTAYALAGAIDRFFQEAKALFEEPFYGVITGGEALLVQPLLNMPINYNPDLVLLGLQDIAKRADVSDELE